jgi:hypothetical protein
MWPTAKLRTMACTGPVATESRQGPCLLQQSADSKQPSAISTRAAANQAPAIRLPRLPKL